jgi:tryptophan synthase beta subunit
LLLCLIVTAITTAETNATDTAPNADPTTVYTVAVCDYHHMYYAQQIPETHSISAGLDYPGVGPEHAWLKDSGRAEYVAVTDKQALEGLQVYMRLLFTVTTATLC